MEKCKVFQRKNSRSIFESFVILYGKIWIFSSRRKSERLLDYFLVIQKEKRQFSNLKPSNTQLKKINFHLKVSFHEPLETKNTFSLWLTFTRKLILKLISCLLIVIYYLETDYIKLYSREKEGRIDSLARKVISSSNSSRGQIWQIVQKMWSYQIYGATKTIQLVENNVIYYQITQI